MIAALGPYKTVMCLMRHRGIGFDELVRRSGVEPRVVAAIIHQRYTPDPQQRTRVSAVLGFPRNRIVWGHRAVMDDHMPERP
jgi:hypothetical protein